MTATARHSRKGHRPDAPQLAPARTVDGPVDRFQLQAKTEAGSRLVRVAEELAVQFATRATEHDREASYPFEAIDALKEAGYFRAPVPEQFGGLGVASVHDTFVAASRLARGEPSVTIGVNMHLAAVINVAQRWRQAVAMKDDGRAERFGGMLTGIGRGGIVMAAGVSEPGQDLTRPSTTAVLAGADLILNGRKIFCTMSPAATLLYVAATLTDDDGSEHYTYVMVPKDAPGVTVHDDWDALGMRASGSNSVTFENVHAPKAALFGRFPAGGLSFGFMEANITAGPFHASASLGVAEVAHAEAARMLARKGGPRARDRVLAGENAVDVSAMRAIFARAGTLIDEYFAENTTSVGTLGEITTLFAEVQSAKAFINETAVRVVDRALAMSGGAGYMAKHPLARAYRDVRAGAFMHPLGANRAYEFVSQVTLGEQPDLS
jgi:alkylation response protein AidB-like acyl-CoA dehydrogenase